MDAPNPNASRRLLVVLAFFAVVALAVIAVALLQANRQRGQAAQQHHRDTCQQEYEAWTRIPMSVTPVHVDGYPDTPVVSYPNTGQPAWFWAWNAAYTKDHTGVECQDVFVAPTSP
jgi:hypothetical protein